MTAPMTTDAAGPTTTETVIADLQGKLVWSTPREVPTKFGPRMLSKADATEWFWNLWRSHKEALKKLGISVGKDLQSNAWEVCWWREIPKEVAEKRKRAVEASRATDTEVDIPCPTGLAYMPFQKAGIAFALERKSTLIADEMGLGKGHPSNTCVLTPTGFEPIGLLAPGDAVIGSNGRPTTVTGVYRRGMLPIFKVTFSDGSWTRVDGDHLWAVWGNNDWHRGNPHKVIATRDLIGKLQDGAGNGRWRIPMVKPIEFPEKPLVIDPYILGVLIADGALTQSAVVFCCGDEDVPKEVEKRLPEGMELRRHKSNNRATNWAIASTTKEQGNLFKRELERLNLEGTRSHQRFIPREYLFGSVAQRIGVLQGLMDTDGEIRDDGFTAYSTTSAALAMDVQFIVESLGGTASISTKEAPKYTYKGQSKIGRPAHTVSIRLPQDIVPVRAQCTRRRYQPHQKYPPVRIIRSIVEDGFADVVCISVAAKDQLYVTEQCVVTHNTIQAIGFVNAHPEFKDVLVITKAGLKLNWWRELRKWLVNPELRDSIGIADGKTLPTTRVVVLNYDIAHKFPNRINRDWDCVILDEAHQIKTPRSRRAKAIAGYKPKKDEDPALASSGIPAKYKLALTGTPIENNIAEMWTVLWWLDRAEFKSKWKLLGMAGQRYVDGAVTDATGKGMNRLQVFLREKIMVRRLKSQVLKELPPKTRTIIEFDPSGMEGLLERERELWGDDEEMADAQAALELAKAEEGEDAYKAALKRLRELQGVKFEEMAAIRRDTSVAKIPKTIEYLEGLIEDGCGKLLVFAHHIEALESFHRHFGTKSVIAHGGHNQEGKDAAVHRFMNDPGCQLFFGSTRAIGEGFTLTAASTVIFHEFDWVPSRMMQAEDRVHRIGQTENVQVHLCVVNGSMDAKMAKACKAKADIADAALDNEVKAAIASEPVGPIDWTPLTPHGRKEIEKEAPTLTQDQIAAIGVGLLQLATVCDGARAIDGHGFNKIDSRIGKELAMVASGRGLTPRQGVLGLRLVNKYRRQLPAEIVDRALPQKVESVEQND